MDFHVGPWPLPSSKAELQQQVNNHYRSHFGSVDFPPEIKRQRLELLDVLKTQQENSTGFYIGFRQIATELSIEPIFLQQVLAGGVSHYKVVSKRKCGRNQLKYRLISMPNPDYARVLKWIYLQILKPTIHKYSEENRFAYAYIMKKSTTHCVAVHRYSDWMYKLDIDNFFGSIKFDVIKGIFQSMGYAESLANELTYFCTVPDGDGTRSLPQGFSTSGILSNLVLKQFDKEVAIWCRHRNRSYCYSRYADDLIFSGKGQVGSRRRYTIKRKVSQELLNVGLILNPSKTIYLPKGETLRALGLEIINTEIFPNKKLVARLNTELENIRKLSYYEACANWTVRSRKRLHSNNPDDFYAFYENYLIGLALYFYSINQQFGKRYIEKLAALDLYGQFSSAITSKLVEQIPDFPVD